MLLPNYLVFTCETGRICHYIKSCSHIALQMWSFQSVIGDDENFEPCDDNDDGNDENVKMIMINELFISDSVEVKPAVTRKLRRRPNDPLPAPEKRRKTSHILSMQPCIYMYTNILYLKINFEKSMIFLQISTSDNLYPDEGLTGLIKQIFVYRFPIDPVVSLETNPL